ncbi:MAG: LacI family DNA-binding transcriptional regulator [Acidobacteria bacterium]|nr:LacI family DNA-binding transcriptional regulator [Acidobacteriota bacterium]
MVTIREVAKRAGVSVGTVSNVLAGSGSVRPELRARVQDAMAALDFHPNQIARSLKTRSTKTLGAIVSDITNPFFPQVIRGAEDAALARGYLMITLNTDDQVERERRAMSLLRARKVDGILLVIAPDAGEPVHIASTLDAGTPVVCLDRIPPGALVDSVGVDNRKGARMCLNHLVSRGHLRIAILAGSPEVQTGHDRLAGYLDVLREHGLEESPALIRPGVFRLESGYLLTKELLLDSNPPSAIFATNAMMGFGALKAMQELGVHCPEDVSLAVFDDTPFGDVIQPRLTVVAQPAYDIGRRGAELLIARIEGRETSPAPVCIQLTPELIVRGSTAALKA